LAGAGRLSDGKKLTIDDIADAENLQVNSRRGIIPLRELTEESIEGWLGQRGRAAPANRISLWLSAIPSA
jgi:hypothetical protein